MDEEQPNPKLAEIDQDEDPPSLDEVGFSPYEQEVRDHWERFLPNLTAQLRAQGPWKLEEAIRKAVHRQTFQELLMLARNPDLHPGQVSELFRQEVFLPPEEPQDQ